MPLRKIRTQPVGRPTLVGTSGRKKTPSQHRAAPKPGAAKPGTGVRIKPAVKRPTNAAQAKKAGMTRSVKAAGTRVAPSAPRSNLHKGGSTISRRQRLSMK